MHDLKPIIFVSIRLYVLTEIFFSFFLCDKFRMNDDHPNQIKLSNSTRLDSVDVHHVRCTVYFTIYSAGIHLISVIFHALCVCVSFFVVSSPKTLNLHGNVTKCVALNWGRMHEIWLYYLLYLIHLSTTCILKQ